MEELTTLLIHCWQGRHQCCRKGNSWSQLRRRPRCRRSADRIVLPKRNMVILRKYEEPIIAGEVRLSSSGSDRYFTFSMTTVPLISSLAGFTQQRIFSYTWSPDLIWLLVALWRSFADHCQSMPLSPPYPLILTLPSLLVSARHNLCENQVHD